MPQLVAKPRRGAKTDSLARGSLRSGQGHILDGRPQAFSLSRRLRFELQENTITGAVFLRRTDRDA